MALFTADSLFARFFWPLYPPDVRAEPERFRNEDANPAGNPHLLLPLADAAAMFVANAPDLLGLSLTMDPDGVGALARALNRVTRDRLIAASNPADPGNPFFNTVVHATAFVGEIAVRSYGGRWSLRRPLWESLVQRRTRGAFAPFHWILKGLADDSVDDAPLAYRFRVHVQQASTDPEAFPVIAPPQRLPSLKSPTYDLVVKYLHQHLGALRDVGEGFPSPTELSDRGFASLGFELLHDGRVLALHGQSLPSSDRPGAVEILWLTAQGYDHADVIPADPGVPYFARAVSRTLVEVTVAWHGRPVTHRLTFQGHA